MRFQKSHNIDREWTQISRTQTLCTKMTLLRSMGELFMALNNRHLTLNEIVGGQAILTGFFNGVNLTTKITLGGVILLALFILFSLGRLSIFKV